MRTKPNRLLAALLSVFMVLSLLPIGAVTVFATENDGNGNVSVFIIGRDDLIAHSEIPLEDAEKIDISKYTSSTSDGCTALHAIAATLKQENLLDDMSASGGYISAIGDVSLASGNAISAARNAYDALTEEQQVLVTNVETLVLAENTYAELVENFNQNLEEIYKSVGDYLVSLGAPGTGTVGGEWMALGLARSGQEVPAAYYDAVVKYVKENVNDKEQLHRAKSTENSRLIVALTALGYDVTDVAGHNLLKGLIDMSYVKKQGINGPVWALIAFDSHNYEIPDGDVTRGKLIEAILSEQLPDGGWALGGSADPDMTAMALQALAPYYQSDETVKAAAEKAIERLSTLQTTTGGYQSWGSLNSESCAQVIVALTGLGIDPTTDARFSKNGVSVMESLLSFYTDGGFQHTADGERNPMATEQGYYALVSMMRFKEGKTGLYDMSDVTLCPEENPNPPEEPIEKPDDPIVKPDNPVVKPDEPVKKPDEPNQGGQEKPGNDTPTETPDVNKPGDNPPNGQALPGSSQNPGGQTTVPSDNNGKPVENPKTEDGFDTIAYFCLMFAFAGFAAVAAAGKRKEKQK